MAQVTVHDTFDRGAVFAGCGRTARLLQHCEYADVGCSWYSPAESHAAAERWRASEAKRRRAESTEATPVDEATPVNEGTPSLPTP